MFFTMQQTTEQPYACSININCQLSSSSCPQLSAPRHSSTPTVETPNQWAFTLMRSSNHTSAANRGSSWLSRQHSGWRLLHEAVEAHARPRLLLAAAACHCCCCWALCGELPAGELAGGWRPPQDALQGGMHIHSAARQTAAGTNNSYIAVKRLTGSWVAVSL
jgi:hypothetical protein